MPTVEIAWFILISVVVALIIFAIASSKVSDARGRRKRRQRLPNVPPPLIAGKTYHIQLSHGRSIASATVIGMSEGAKGQHWDDWQHRNWIVVKGPDGRLMYLQTNSIRVVEDA